MQRNVFRCYNEKNREQTRGEIEMQKTFAVKSRDREEMIAITDQLEALIEGADSGVLSVFVHHTTCGLTINEGADPDVRADLIAHFNHLVPRDASFRHAEGNSDAHIKSSLCGVHLQIPVRQGRLLLGRWQQVYLCEWDGPRQRQITATLQGGGA